MEEHDIARGPVDQGADGRSVALPDDAVALPMPGHLAVIDIGGALADQRSRVDKARGALVGVPPSAAARLAAGAQRAGRSLPAAVSQIDRLVDGLVRAVTFRFVGEGSAKGLADLLGAPPLVEPLLDVSLQLRVPPYLASLGARTSHDRSPLRAKGW